MAALPSMKIKKGRLLLLLCIVMGMCASSATACLHYWRLHARLNLLVRGCPFCRIEAPSNEKGISDWPPGIMFSGLVYSGEKCVGWLTQDGALIFRGESPSSQDKREFRTQVILLAVRNVTGLLFVTILLIWIWRYAKQATISKARRG